MSSRDVVLARVREALADRPVPAEVEWEYGTPTAMPDVVERLVERVRDYGAVVERCTPDEVGARLVQALRTHAAGSVVLPTGLDTGWAAAVAEAVDVRPDDLDAAGLDAIDAVVTGCAVAMAESGTIALDHGPGQGRRALTLVPDLHVCVVRVDQVVSDVPEAVARLAEAAAARRPITWISGGSATSDIELSRVEGVHGPRTLHVLVVG